ncbi:MAG: rod-binding protein [Alphaproteobacteria bacterium]|nr:rod-binding protein [Alphaproteobacteria bacterium]
MTVILPKIQVPPEAVRQKIEARSAERLKPGQSQEQFQQVSREFEAMFMAEMLKPMFEGVGNPNGIFGGGHGEEVFKSLMVQEYGKILADRGGLGIAKQLEARYQTTNPKTEPTEPKSPPTPQPLTLPKI